MHSVLVQVLLVFLTLINCHLVHAEDAAPVCAENAAPVSADMQHPMIEHAHIGQEVFQPQDPHVPFSGNKPLTAAELIRFVQKDYADPLPPNIGVQQILEDVRGNEHSWGKSKPLSWYFRVDVRVPWMPTCRPVIRGTKRLSEGIVCGNTNGCSFNIRLVASETYSNTESLQIETTVSVGVAAKGVSASVSTTTARSWEKTWSRSQGSERGYTFDLVQNERCIPSMAHVELECDVDFDTVQYDSYFRRPRDFTDLEYNRNRKGGPFDSGQWCFKQRVSSTPLNRNNDWHEVLPNDGHDGNRGDIWKRPGSEMNQFRVGSGGIFRDQDIIIRRARRSGGDMNEIFGCRRNPQLRRRQRIIVPLSSATGALEGHIGCVVA